MGIYNATRKLGLYDDGHSSALVLNCREAGFLINTFQFDHTQPVRGGGPQGQLFIKKEYPVPIFSTTSSSLVIQGYVKHPYHHWEVEDAVGQMGMAYYVQPLTCFFYSITYQCPAATLSNNIPAFAHLFGIYDTRAIIGTGIETFGTDTYTGFFVSPFADFDALGRPLRFATKSIYSANTATRYDIWNNYQFFRSEVSYSQMQEMIRIVRDGSKSIQSVTSSDPRDWGIVLITGLVEAFPATLPQCIKNNNVPSCNNVVVGVSFAYVEAYEDFGGGLDRNLTQAGEIDLGIPMPLGIGSLERETFIPPPIRLLPGLREAPNAKEGFTFSTIRARALLGN